MFCGRYGSLRETAFNPIWFIAIFLIVGPVLMIWGSAKYIISDQTTSKCSSVTYGIVVNVEKEQRLTHQGFLEESYIATVEPSNKNIFNSSTLRSGETGYAYEKGRNVQINYDPSDPSTYYIEHANPSKSGLSSIIAGAVLFFLGLIILVIYKRLKYWNSKIRV